MANFSSNLLGTGNGNSPFSLGNGSGLSSYKGSSPFSKPPVQDNSFFQKVASAQKAPATSGIVNTSANTNIATTPPPITPPPNANGLTDAQVAQGYSTIPGQFNPVTGQPNNPQPGVNTGLLASGGAPVANGNPRDAAQGVLNSGQQTPQEQQTFQGLVGQSQNPSQAYMKAEQDYQTAVTNLANFNANEKKAMHAIEIQGIPMAGIVGQEASLSKSLSGQQDALAQAVTQGQQGLGYANTQQGLQLQAGTAANQAAQTQAGRAQTGAADVLSTTVPQQVSPTNVPYNPITQQYGAPASTAYGNGGLASVGAVQSQIGQGGDVATMKSSIDQTSGLIQKTKTDIANNPSFNLSPIPLGNVLQDWVQKNIAPSPQYSNIVNDLSEVANTIAPVLGVPGNPTNLKTIIANELVPRFLQGQDIGTVLDNLEANANIKYNAALQASKTNPYSGGSQNSGTQPTSGNFQEGQQVSTNGMSFVFKQGHGWVPAS